jgi:RNA polymerase sigma-70 factor (ECF subfamily)
MSETPVSLLDRLRDRPDGADWKRLVALYTPLLRGWLRRYALPPEDADDLVQDVLGVVVRELPKFRHSQQRGAFRHWLRTILVNRLRGYWRGRQQQPRATGDSDFARMLEQLEDPASALSRQWDQEHDRHVCRRLLELVEPDFEPSTWRAFRRTVLDGVPAADVATETGLSVNAVLIAKSRVLRRLRNECQGLTD